MDIKKIIKEEMDDFDWVKKLKTSNTDNFIDLINNTLERLPTSYSDRGNELSYEWINEIRLNIQSMLSHEARQQTFIGHLSLWTMLVQTIRNLDRIKRIISKPSQPEIYTHHRFNDTDYEEEREKLEGIKDHLDNYHHTVFNLDQS